MPRTARKKSSESMYHVMSRSISEVNLFKCDEDKDYYLHLLKKYISMYRCSLYAYCLMDNHVHLYINPNGFDISRFMHCLNTAYVSYFIYIGKRKDKEGLLDMSFILSVFSKDEKKAMKKYYEFTKIMKDTGIMTEIDDEIMQAYTENEYRSEKKHIERNVRPDDVVRIVCDLVGEPQKEVIRLKYSRRNGNIRALIVYGMRLLCGYTFKK